jgi:beta-fructofuranosidase
MTYKHLVPVLFLVAVSLRAQSTLAVWHFDESSGLFSKESVGNSNFPVRNDFPKPESEWLGGVSGNALRLNGYASWVEGNLTTPLPGDQITVSAWIAPEVYPLSSAAIFTNVSGNTGVYVGIDKFGRLEIGAATNGFFSQKISAAKVQIRRWSHIALTVNTSEGKLRGYINGVLVAEQSISAGALNWSAAGALKIGKHQASPVSGIYETGLFCGLIDEIKIFDKALIESALSGIFNSELPAVFPDLSIPTARFEGDPHRPIFHAIPAANWMNEPHGLIYHNGLYHIFYQKNGNGPYWGRLNWGHQTSPDLVTWTEQAVVLFPDPASPDQEGCWSGCSIKKDNIPYIMYTGVDGATAQMCLAQGNNNLSSYDKYNGNPVVATPPAPYTSNDFRDPYIWEENGTYYMIIGSGLGGSGNSGGAALLYKSTNLSNWQYLKVLHKGYPQTDNSGVFWEVPMLLNFGGKRVLTAQPVPQSGAPARILYWTGTFAQETFTPDSIKPKLLEPGDALLGVTTTTDPLGRTIAIGIIPDILPAEEQRKHGWANLMSLPRVWSLSTDGKTLLQQPLPELQKLRGANYHAEQVAIAAGQNTFLPNISGRHLEIKALIDPGTATRVGIVVAKSPDNSERTRIFWDVPFGIIQIERNNSSSNFSAPKGVVSTLFSQPAGQPLDLHIFLDGSVLEVFINNEKALSTRIYPENPESVGLDLFTQGGTATIQSLDVWNMKSMYDESVGTSESPATRKKNAIIQVFPNPNTGSGSIDLDLPEAGNIELRIVDLLGKTLFVNNLGPLNAGAQQLQFDALHLASGTYFIQAIKGSQMLGTAIFIKQ